MENNVPDNSQGYFDPANSQGNHVPGNGQGYYAPNNNQGYYAPGNDQGYAPGNNYGNYVPNNGQGGFVVEEKHENVLLGIIGAFLFALAGGVVWFLLDLVNFVAGISGFVAVYCAIQGYKKFAGNLSKKGVIISAVIAMLVLVFAWYLCFVKDFYQALKEMYGDSPLMLSFSDCFRRGFELLGDSEIAKGYWVSLAIGLGLAVLGAFGTVRQAFKEGK